MFYDRGNDVLLQTWRKDAGSTAPAHLRPAEIATLKRGELNEIVGTALHVSARGAAAPRAGPHAGGRSATTARPR